MTCTRVIVLLAWSIGAASCATFLGGDTSGILMDPYLQAVTDTSAYVLVETNSQVPVTVEFGPSASYGEEGTTESAAATEESTFVHNIPLRGLRPGTVYHYRASVNGSSSRDAAFATAPLPGVPIRFAWMADTRGDTTVHDSIAARVARAGPALLLFGGDTGPTSSYRSFKSHFFRPLQRALIARVPFFNATGNHERWGTNTKAFTEAPQSGSGSQAYYSFDWGDLHVLLLNTEVPYGPGTPQFAFAASDLAGTHRSWKIVASHKPAYCGGGHGEDGDMKTLTREVFEPNGVCMVLSGHTHFFQHNIVHGVRHMVIGSAGAPLYTPEPAPYTVASARSYNFALADVSPDVFKLVVYNERGATLDSLELHRTGP